ncbi:MAG: AraC family transcriptional regulator [Chitinophagaceae bacterium]|nr:MAG: AraC family transcriptional regulator [Chitinophagaceae bacterium]
MRTTSPPLPAVLPAPISIRNVSFQQVQHYLGLQNELFYLADSRDRPVNRALLRPFKLQEFSVLFVDSGALTLRYGTDTLQLSAGSLLLRLNDSVLQVRQFSADCRVRVLGFTRELVSRSGLHKKHLEALAFLSAQAHPHLMLSESEATAIGALLDILQTKSRLTGKPPFYEETVAHAFALLALELAASLQRVHGRSLPGTQRGGHLTLQFLHLVQEHVTHERSVQFYAARLNVTPKYLSRCVKEATGRTCSEQINELVVLEAKVLLDDPGLSIAQVADRLHFSNPFYFSRFFKSHTGLTPSSYRHAN